MRNAGWKSCIFDVGGYTCKKEHIKDIENYTVIRDPVLIITPKLIIYRLTDICTGFTYRVGNRLGGSH